MNPDDLHDLLTRVADGSLDPADASRLLDPQRRGGADAAQTDPTSSRRSEPAVQGVTVTANGVRLAVVADPSVATAVAEGPHELWQDGDRLHLELPGRAATDAARRRWQFGSVRIDWPYGSGERVRLRVNPALELRLELTACDAKVRGTRGPLQVGCFSGSITVTDHDGPLSGTVTTGSARIEAVLRGAQDTFSCDMGSLQLTLLPGSDTRIVGYSDMGSVKISGTEVTTGPDARTGLGTASHAVVGAGTGHLMVGVRMGSAKVLT